MTLLKYLRDNRTPAMGRKFNRRTGAEAVMAAPALRTAQTTAIDRKRRPRVDSASRPSTIGKLNVLPMFDDRSGETQAHRTAYKQMMKEPAVKAAVLGKALAVAALDLTVTPENAESKREQEVAEFVRWNLLNIGQGIAGQTVGIPGLVENIVIPKLIDGYVVAHKRFEPIDKGTYAGKYRLSRVTAKPTEAYTLGLDEFNQVQSIQGRQWNSGEEFDPQLFVYGRYLPLFDSPLGTSDFRAAYRAYVLKDMVTKLRAIYLEKFGTGFLVGKYAKDDQKALLETALAAARGSTWMTVPEDVIIESVNIASRGTADYESAIRDLDHEIAVGIQGAFLQSGEGSTTGSYGMGKVHQTTSELFVWYVAENLAGDANGQLVPDIVDLNYWNIQAYPRVGFGGVNDGELEAATKIDEALARMGWEHSRKDLEQRYKRTWASGPEDRVTMPQPAMQPGGLPALPAGGPASNPFRFADAIRAAILR